MQLERASYLTASCRTLLSTVLLIIPLSSGTQPNSNVALASSSPLANHTAAIRHTTVPLQALAFRPQGSLLWASRFGSPDWQQHWGIRKENQFGLQQHTQIIRDPSGIFSQVLRVYYPAGSASPTVSRKYGAPTGGAQFYADLGISPRNYLRLSYYVRFSDNFNFVQGGKMPGLFGGVGNDGGNIPNGTDGFSTRYMWRTNGDGEVYAYLPTSIEHGTSIGRGNWRFQPGRWYHLEQAVRLNQPGNQDGRIQVWLDGQQVLNQEGLTFRTTDELKINGIFFSTFFGGDDPSWETPKNVYADFANFAVFGVNQG